MTNDSLHEQQPAPTSGLRISSYIRRQQPQQVPNLPTKQREHTLIPQLPLKAVNGRVDPLIRHPLRARREARQYP